MVYRDFFKVCKSYLKLVNGTKTISYDALNAHIAIVFTRYMFLSSKERCDKDQRSICEIFYIMIDELDDITFVQSLTIIFDALVNFANNSSAISNQQKDYLLNLFLANLHNFPNFNSSSNILDSFSL